MRDSDDEAPKDGSRAFAAVVGIGALLAWFVMLYLMFGDVL